MEEEKRIWEENEVLRQLAERKSVRVFEDCPVSAPVKDALLEAAFQAPTAGNQMLYTILDVTDSGLKETLAVKCDNQPFIAKAPLVFVFLADCKRWLDTYEAAGCPARRPGKGDLLLAVADAVIAAQNMVAAAWSMGLGSCYIGDILENCEEIRELLHLPEEVVPAAMLVLGYPTEQQKERQKPARFEKEYIVFENQYRTLTPQMHREMFEKQAAKGDRRNWEFERDIRAFCNRKYESDFSREMSRSAGEYLKSFE